jgi:hypothetical protein
MAKANLTAARLRELVEYDPATGHLLRKKAHRGNAAGRSIGYLSHEGYLQAQLDGRKYQQHRLVWLYITGEWPRGEIDHINCVRDDNRISNLRDVEKCINAQNRRSAQKNSATGALGVTKNGNRFAARIIIAGRYRHLGMYGSVELAHAAYVAAKREIHPGGTL